MDEAGNLSHTNWQCKYHTVFTRNAAERRCTGSSGAIWGRSQEESRIEGGHLMPEHVHMMIEIPPNYAVSLVVGYI